MKSNKTLNPIAVALGTTFAISLSASPLVNAADNPFALTELGNAGYMVADSHEGKCGEAKCGADKKSEEGKCGEAKCGADKKSEEGKCGDKKAEEGKCGEGKCGGDKKAEEGKCGDNH